jgi:hypothetical protein
MSKESGLDDELVEYPPPTNTVMYACLKGPFLLIPGAGQRDWNGAFTRDRTQVSVCGARCWTTDGASGLHCGSPQTGGQHAIGPGPLQGTTYLETKQRHQAEHPHIFPPL